MAWSRRRLLAATALAGLAGCSAQSGPAEQAATPTVPVTSEGFAYTHLRAGGNRRLRASGAIDEVSPVDVPVDGTPVWLVASGETESNWTVVTDDGTATTYRVSDATAEERTDHGRVSAPPLVSVTDGSVTLLDHPTDCAAYTHPVVFESGLLYVADDGDVVLERADSETRLDADAPPDARLARVGDGRYVLYGGQTDRYRHGALGDTTEGSALLFVDPAGERIETEVRLDEPLVFEGLLPIVADLDGDGEPEIVTTVADSADGARIRVYDSAGTAVGTGRIYGPGWRHQLCVAAFAPDGHPEIAVVRKPHVDRTAEFYRLTDGSLQITATQSGYATHTYGSRNVDGGLAGDLDGDQRVELLVPTTNRQRLEALRRTETGAATAWALSLDGQLSTNVTGVGLDDGVAVGAGTAGTVRIWQA